MTVPAANVPSFSHQLKQQMKTTVNTTSGPLWVNVKLDHQGDNVTISRLGNGFTLTGNPKVTVVVDVEALRLRWVLTPELDGRQLQYSFDNNEWHPIMTEFDASKLETDKVFKLVEVGDDS